MLITNGTCVSSTVKTSAGSSGSARAARGGAVGRGEAPPSPAPPAGTAATLRRSMAISPVMVASADGLGGDVLAGAQCVVDARPTGDDAGELLRAAVADVLELGMPTYCTPGRPGGAWCPGCRSAPRPSPPASGRRTRRRPPGTRGSRRSRAGCRAGSPPIRRRSGCPRPRCTPVRSPTRCTARPVSGSGEFCGMASAQLHSQPDASVSFTGAMA